ncbi:MAG: RNA 2',3'-cyclic phosphodiesterase [Actinomycetes bacterium]
MRVFLSLRPPPEVRAHLAAAVAGLRTTDVAQWHVTLVFLGEISSERPLLPALGEVTATTPPLRLRVRGGGAFRRAGVLWAGLDGDVDGLVRLAARLADACRAGGVALEDRPFCPHLTVARRARDASLLEGYEGPAWTADEVEVVQSSLGATTRHRVLHRLPLQG